MLDQLLPQSNHFSIKHIDRGNNHVLVEDKELGLEIKLPWGQKDLKEAKIVGPYEIQFIYTDGTSRIIPHPVIRRFVNKIELYLIIGLVIYLAIVVYVKNR